VEVRVITPDGIAAAANREAEAHPVDAKGKPITAWARRRDTLEATIAETNALRVELDAAKVDVAEAKALLEELKSRPF